MYSCLNSKKSTDTLIYLNEMNIVVKGMFDEAF